MCLFKKKTKTEKLVSNVNNLKDLANKMDNLTPLCASEEIKAKVLPIIQKYRIPAMYLFGSYARGDATEESDIDFLVDTTGTKLTSLLSLGALYCDLEEVFDKRVDLITIRAIMQESSMESDIDFRNAVLRERVKLYDVA